MLVLWMMGRQWLLSFAPKVIHSQADRKMLEEQGLGEVAFILSHGIGEGGAAIGSVARDRRIARRLCRGGCPSAPLSPVPTKIHSGRLSRGLSR